MGEICQTTVAAINPHMINFADPTRGNHILHMGEGRVVAHVEAAPQMAFGGMCSGDNAPGRRDILRQRFFRQDMQARREKLDACVGIISDPQIVKLTKMGDLGIKFSRNDRYWEYRKTNPERNYLEKPQS